MKTSKKNVLHGMTRNFIGLICLMLMLSLVLVSCNLLPIDDIVPTVDDYEPNDERSEAFIIALDTTYDARISDDDDDDWFKITPAHGSDTYDQVQISVTDVSQSLFIRITIYASDGEELDYDYASTGGQDLTYTFATPGVDYYVRFSGDIGYGVDHESNGNYSFTVSYMDANDEFAPNHSFETAEESLEFGNAYDGVLVSQYEDDFYKFTNPSPGTWNSYTISLTNVSGDLFGSFERYGADRASLGRTYGTTQGADVSYTLTSNEDEFYLRVSGDIGYGLDHYSKGSYTLTVTNNGNDDNEPDDTFGDAREITSYPTDLTGTILSDAANDNGGDYEFFKVTIANNKKVSWSVDPDAANTELHFHVYNASQTYLGNEDGGDGQTINGNMSNTTGSDSFIYIKLGGFIGDNGDYSISFTETDAD